MVECTQYTLHFETSREFISDEGGAFVVVPTTFEPNQLGEYELHVYTDDADAQLAPLPATTWQARGQTLPLPLPLPLPYPLPYPYP